MRRPARARLAVLTSRGLAWGCAPSSETASTVRLIDRFPDATVENFVATVTPATPIEWRFDGDGKGTRGWKAGEVKGFSLFFASLGSAISAFVRRLFRRGDADDD